VALRCFVALAQSEACCSTTPVQVSGLSGVTAIAGAEYYSLALKGDGTVWTWGNTCCGRSTPVQVSA
jgi:alpha-tubulin suppressor-like RCC1 family protein